MIVIVLTKAFKIVSRQALKNAMYCHLKSYSCTSSGTKVQSVLQPRSAPIVPSICSIIFAKRSWRFWAQESENV